LAYAAKREHKLCVQQTMLLVNSFICRECFLYMAELATEGSARTVVITFTKILS
jgi:hypothetical protein